MRQRPIKAEGAPDGGPDDVGALLASNGGIPLLPPMLEPRRQAQLLYWCRWRIADIALAIGVPEGTISAWKSRDKWDDSSPLMRCEGAVEAQFVQLVLKQGKSGSDFKEIDLLGRQLEKFARIRRYQEPGGNETDLNPNVANRNKGDRKKPERNRITAEQTAILKARFLEIQFAYQRTWWSKSDLRNRNILKSRQIGASYYFSLESLIVALETGKNQIWLSASKSQAHIARGYVRTFVMETIGVELSGDPIVIDRGEDDDGRQLPQPTLYYLGTNARTAQGYHGDFYFDEYFWVFGFQVLKKVASGMAMHKQYRRTYFSAPSSITHEGHAFWSGDEWNRKRPKDKRQEFETGWKATKDGLLLPDNVWRHTVTIEDAERGGCNLFDVEELRDEYSAPEFANLLMCEFMDDSLSVFPMAMLAPCMVDEQDEWTDVDHVRIALGHGKPYAGEVWLSYDPNGDGENADAAGLIVLAPPARPGGRFRVLERRQFKGSDFTDQAEVIRAYTKRYNVTKIDIDKTGIGNAVFQLVRTFFPTVTGHMYDHLVKQQMVYKALDVVMKHRIQIPAGFRDLLGAMMSIRRTMTASGRNVTYEASRTKNSGHADLAWALFQSLANEPIEAAIGGGSTSSVVIS